MASQLQLFDAPQAGQWSVRVSPRARRLSVRVYPGGRVEVVAPQGVSAAVVQRFVGVHREWIDRRVEDLSASRGPMDALRPNAIELAALGLTLQIRYEPVSCPHFRMRFEELASRLIVSGPVHDELQVARALREWLMGFATRRLSHELKEEAARSGFEFNRVQVRRQRTRWGSCSSKGAISLNVCILFLPRPVMRYLFIHELAHTRHMNHSARFWALVNRHEPDFRRLDRELTRGWRCVPAWVFA